MKINIRAWFKKYIYNGESLYTCPYSECERRFETIKGLKVHVKHMRNNSKGHSIKR